MGSVFAFLAEHRETLFPGAMSADMHPSTNGRPAAAGATAAGAATGSGAAAATGATASAAVASRALALARSTLLRHEREQYCFGRRGLLLVLVVVHRGRVAQRTQGPLGLGGGEGVPAQASAGTAASPAEANASTASPARGLSATSPG
ncbi:hypothetical protein ACFC1R_15250 [Kitasatospora sp. NPDC056138]|uniref:hypothetical protein n=1 Tax=Kitasatospora sp. NPDC056138 TaxID=3345724 RepID=UPI0035E34087